MQDNKRYWERILGYWNSTKLSRDTATREIERILKDMENASKETL